MEHHKEGVSGFVQTEIPGVKGSDRPDSGSTKLDHNEEQAVPSHKRSGPDPATRFVRSLPGDYFMLREAADELDLSSYTLRKYISEDIDGLTPSKAVMFGKVQVYLYTRADIDRMREILIAREEVRPYDRIGRPSKFSLEQRKERARLFSRRHYWRKMLEKAEFMEDDFRLQEVKEELSQIEQELKDGESGDRGNSSNQDR